MGLQNKEDIQVKPECKYNTALDHIVYDPQQREYYNKRIDIFLTEDDISFYKLRPYDKITTPLPSPLPPDYFVNF